MIHPTADEQLAAIIETFDRDVVPHVDDEYAASLCRTIGQLLRSVRVRAAEEAPALYADNHDLRSLLVTVRPHGSDELAADIDAATGEPPPAYPSLAELQAEAVKLRTLLERCIEEIPDRDHPLRSDIRSYLQRQLESQRPWMVDAFDGPRR